MNNEPMLVHILQKVDEVRESQLRMEGKFEKHMDSHQELKAKVYGHDRVLRIVIIPVDAFLWILKKLKFIA